MSTWRQRAADPYLILFKVFFVVKKKFQEVIYYFLYNDESETKKLYINMVLLQNCLEIGFRDKIT